MKVKRLFVVRSPGDSYSGEERRQQQRRMEIARRLGRHSSTADAASESERRGSARDRRRVRDRRIGLGRGLDLSDWNV